MKRKAISIMLALVLCLSLLPVTAWAAETAHNHDEITFEAWNGTTTLLDTAGSWYLTDDVMLSETWSVPAGVTKLCLNGKTVRMSGTGGVITVPEGAALNLYDCDTETVNGGVITGGSAELGGGVYNEAGKTFTVYSGTLSGNAASETGGGICNGGTAELSGCEISDNEATDFGGGIYSEGAVGLETCAITGCSAEPDYNGGGIYLGSGGSIFLGRSAQVKDNTVGGAANNLYLCGDTMVKFGTGEDVKAPAPDMSIGVTAQITPTKGETVQITINGTQDCVGCIVPDDPAYETAFETDHLVLQVRTTPAPASHDEPTYTVPVSGEENTVNVRATVSGKTATVKPVREEEIEKVIGGEAETGMITVDLSGLERTVTGAKLPTETVEAIADAAAETGSDTAGMELKFTSGALEFDAKALGTIAEAAGDAKNIEIHLDDAGTTRLNAEQKNAVSEMVVVKGFEAYVTANGSRIHDFNGGHATVSISFTPENGRKAENYIVNYIDKSGKVQNYATKYEDGELTFITVHFSDYVIIYEEQTVLNCPKDETCPLSRFIDTANNAWWHDGIHYCVEEGIMNGMTDTQFDPNGTITRGMIVTMLYRLEGEPAFMNDNVFSDIANGSWYEKAIVWANGKGIVKGYGDGAFGPDEPVTREQLATILYGYAKYKGQGFTGSWMFLLDFVDRADISSWADEAVHWCSMKGVVTGKDGKVFDPQGYATRAEAAAMMQRLGETLGR